MNWKHCSAVSESSFILTALVQQWVPELVTFPWKLLRRSLAEETVRDLSIGAIHLIASFGVQHLNVIKVGCGLRGWILPTSLSKLWKNMALKLHPQQMQLVVAPQKSWCLMLAFAAVSGACLLVLLAVLRPATCFARGAVTSVAQNYNPYRSLPCPKLVVCCCERCTFVDSVCCCGLRFACVHFVFGYSMWQMAWQETSWQEDAVEWFFFPHAVSYVANEICERSCCGSPKNAGKSLGGLVAVVWVQGDREQKGESITEVTWWKFWTADNVLFRMLEVLTW